MNIVIIGVTGRVGSRLAQEALRRGHQVTGVVRQATGANAVAGVTLAEADANQPQALAPLLKNHDAVLSAATFQSLSAAPLLQALKLAGVPRLLVVGGAGSLEIAPDTILLDSPHFPEAYRKEATLGKQFLDELRAEHTIDWSFLSPAAMFEPGERRGSFRLGQDQLLQDAAGQSVISMEDYAIAMIDELEQAQHSRQRFSVAY